MGTEPRHLPAAALTAAKAGSLDISSPGNGATNPASGSLGHG